MVLREDLNNDFDNFFQSPPEQMIKRRQRSEITIDERGTSNEANNERTIYDLHVEVYCLVIMMFWLLL